MRIGEIIKAKASQDIVTIPPDAGVRELLAKLAEHNIGALIVSSDGKSLDGIVSERDVVRHLHSDGTVINNVVSAIMTDAVETCAPEDDLDTVMHTMTDRRFRHIPVVKGGALVGIISIGDVVKSRLEQVELEANVLREAYLVSH